MTTSSGLGPTPTDPEGWLILVGAKLDEILARLRQLDARHDALTKRVDDQAAEIARLRAWQERVTWIAAPVWALVQLAVSAAIAATR